MSYGIFNSHKPNVKGRKIVCAAEWCSYRRVSRVLLKFISFHYFIVCRKTISASRATHESYIQHEEDKNIWRCPRDETQTLLLTLLSDIGDTMSFPKLRESCAIKQFLWRVYGTAKKLSTIFSKYSQILLGVSMIIIWRSKSFFRKKMLSFINNMKLYRLIEIIRFYRFKKN